MNFLDLVNSVLLRLRETEVSSVSSTAYSRLIGQYVNEIKEEMEDIWDWSWLTVNTNFSISSGQRAVSLIDPSAAVTNGNYANLRSRLIYDPARRPMCFDITDSGEERQLYETNVNGLRQRSNLGLEEAAEPTAFALWVDAGDDLRIRMDTVMDKDRDFSIFLFTPQDMFSLSTNVDDTTDVLLPVRPIRLGALYLALNERGEELGEPGGVAETNYRMALAAAIEADDAARQEYLYRYFKNDEVGSSYPDQFNYSEVWK